MEQVSQRASSPLQERHDRRGGPPARCGHLPRPSARTCRNPWRCPPAAAPGLRGRAPRAAGASPQPAGRGLRWRHPWRSAAAPASAPPTRRGGPGARPTARAPAAGRPPGEACPSRGAAPWPNATARQARGPGPTLGESPPLRWPAGHRTPPLRLRWRRGAPRREGARHGTHPTTGRSHSARMDSPSDTAGEGCDVVDQDPG